jgi:hypothetical protein
MMSVIIFVVGYLLGGFSALIIIAFTLASQRGREADTHEQLHGHEPGTDTPLGRGM